jgi:uncharacterized protein (TIGR02145 family)
MVLRCLILLAFLFLGCSSPEFNSPYDEKSPDYIGNVSSSSSSSIYIYYSSNSVVPCVDGIVVIGTQTWRKCNLNVVPKAGNSWCYGNDPNNCLKYGRLYDWATAMDLPSYCNSSSCASQVSSKHRGICPEGWHIPSDAEWTALTDYVGGSSIAARKLKSQSGWNSCGPFGSGSSYVCEDAYGFSALPDGYSNDVGVSDQGHWWSSTENEDATNFAWLRRMSDYYDGVDRHNQYKTISFSVRCLQDSAPPSSSSVAPSSSSSLPSSSSYVCNQEGIVDGSPVSYDGEIYETVVICNQTWLKRNLNYVPSTGNSWCYSGTDYSTGSGVSITAEEGCAKYGRLYDWATAMNLPSDCNFSSCASQVQTKHQGICPSGWHIPTNDDWSTLENNVGGSGTAGKHLKSTSGWSNNGNGLDTYGFSALPGGYRNTDGYFYNAGYYGLWWSASEDGSGYAYSRLMRYDYDNANWNYDDKAGGFSVRCVKDSAP